MEQEKKQGIALMRYGAIAPLVNGPPDGCVRMSEYFREVSERGIRQPNGKTRRYDERTLARWYRTYMAGGFDALMPGNRADEGKSRVLDDELQSRIRHFHEQYPRMSAAAIFRQLCADGSAVKGELSESTVNRFIQRLDTGRETSPDAPETRRYERPYINEVWCGDSSAALMTSIPPPHSPRGAFPFTAARRERRAESTQIYQLFSLKHQFPSFLEKPPMKSSKIRSFAHKFATF